jgi:imidazolonepropionase-like amidohydrolase
MTVLPGLIDVHTHLTSDNNWDPYHTVDLGVMRGDQAIVLGKEHP